MFHSIFIASSSYQTNWEASPDETKRNQSYVSFTVGNLKPNTGYRFRIIAWNEVGASPPSDPSDKAFTGQSGIDIVHSQYGFEQILFTTFLGESRGFSLLWSRSVWSCTL